MRQASAINEAEMCRERHGVARCAECARRGAPDCVWNDVDFGPPPRKPSAQRREETVEERVQRIFASA